MMVIRSLTAWQWLDGVLSISPRKASSSMYLVDVPSILSFISALRML